MISEKTLSNPNNTSENLNNNTEIDNNEIINIIQRNLFSLNRENTNNNHINMILTEMPVVQEVPIIVNNSGLLFPSVSIRNLNRFRTIRIRSRRSREETNLAYAQGFVIGFVLNLFCLFLLISSRARPKLKTGMLLGMIVGFCLFTTPLLEEMTSKK